MEPTIYLFFKGDCLEAMTHYAETLGGVIRKEDIFRNADAPDPESRMPGGDDLIMNLSMRLGSATIMASDNTEAMYETPRGFRVSIGTTSREEFDRIYAVLARDAKSVEMAPDATFWSQRFAMFTDRYGTPWMLSQDGGNAQ